MRKSKKSEKCRRRNRNPSNLTKLPELLVASSEYLAEESPGEECLWKPGSRDFDLQEFQESVLEAFKIGTKHETDSAELSGNGVIRKHDEIVQMTLDTLHFFGNDQERARHYVLQNCTAELVVHGKKDMALFLEGLKNWGKNFVRIRKELLPSLTVADLVSYYYRWKMSPLALGVEIGPPKPPGNQEKTDVPGEKQISMTEPGKVVLKPLDNSEPVSNGARKRLCVSGNFGSESLQEPGQRKIKEPGTSFLEALLNKNNKVSQKDEQLVGESTKSEAAVSVAYQPVDEVDSNKPIGQRFPRACKMDSILHNSNVTKKTVRAGQNDRGASCSTLSAKPEDLGLITDGKKIVDQGSSQRAVEVLEDSYTKASRQLFKANSSSGDKLNGTRTKMGSYVHGRGAISERLKGFAWANRANQVPCYDWRRPAWFEEKIEGSLEQPRSFLLNLPLETNGNSSSVEFSGIDHGSMFNVLPSATLAQRTLQMPVLPDIIPIETSCKFSPLFSALVPRPLLMVQHAGMWVSSLSDLPLFPSLAHQHPPPTVGMDGPRQREPLNIPRAGTVSTGSITCPMVNHRNVAFSQMTINAKFASKPRPGNFSNSYLNGAADCLRMLGGSIPGGFYGPIPSPICPLSLPCPPFKMHQTFSSVDHCDLQGD